MSRQRPSRHQETLTTADHSRNIEYRMWPTCNPSPGYHPRDPYWQQHSPPSKLSSPLNRTTNSVPQPPTQPPRRRNTNRLLPISLQKVPMRTWNSITRSLANVPHCSQSTVPQWSSHHWQVHSQLATSTDSLTRPKHLCSTSVLILPTTPRNPGAFHCMHPHWSANIVERTPQTGTQHLQ